jgi:hypothetical protein
MQKASQFRQAIWRLARLTDGETLGWTTIIKALEEPDLSAAQRYQGVIGNSHWRPPAEVKAEVEAMSVALAQRAPIYDAAGNLVADRRDPRYGTALGRFCMQLQKQHRDRFRRAGERYAQLVIEDRKARGLHVLGWNPTGGYAELTDEQRREWRQRARADKMAAESVIARIDSMALSIARTACYEDRDILPDQGRLLLNVLSALADFFEAPPKAAPRDA